MEQPPSLVSPAARVPRSPRRIRAFLRLLETAPGAPGYVDALREYGEARAEEEQRTTA